MAQTEIEQIIESIENFYANPPETPPQLKSVFTANELKTLNGKPAQIGRSNVYKDLQEKLGEDSYIKVLVAIYHGFDLMAEDKDSITDTARAYREAKKRIEKKVKDENKKLAETDPYFKNLPIIIEFKHHLDSPGKGGRPPLYRNMLIKEISKCLSTYIPGQADRARRIERILRFFYAVHEHEANARNIKSHCK